MRDLIEGVQRFQAQIYPSHRALFEHLAHGQSPEVLFVTCADSRVDPSLLTQSPPGKLFILRNAGNLVPAFDHGPSGEAATVAYAVDHLKVHHIVVCGHAGCGAVAAVLDGHEGDVVADWLEQAGDLDVEVARRWPGLTGAERLRAAVPLNALRQLTRLRTHPCVARAEDEGRLSLHAWVYDIGSGKVSAFEPRTGKFAPLAATPHEEPLLAELAREEPPVEEGWVDHGPWEASLVAVGGRPADVADAVGQITGWPRHEVAVALSRLPQTLMQGLTEMEASVVKAWLEDAGATVAISA